ITREQAEHQAANDARRAQLAALGQPDTYENRLRLRLWEELGPVHDRRCVYTGEQIGIERLLSASVGIDHILPFRESFDDSPANKLLCAASANARKGKRTPYAAFGHTPEWPDIQRRAENLPKNKRWRFADDAPERLKLARGAGLPADALAD